MHLLEDQALSGLSGDEWIPELEVTLLFPTFGGPGAALPWMQIPRNPTEGASLLCSGRVPIWFLQAQQDLSHYEKVEDGLVNLGFTGS